MSDTLCAILLLDRTRNLSYALKLFLEKRLESLLEIPASDQSLQVVFAFISAHIVKTLEVVNQLFDAKQSHDFPFKQSFLGFSNNFAQYNNAKPLILSWFGDKDNVRNLVSAISPPPMDMRVDQVKKDGISAENYKIILTQWMTAVVQEMSHASHSLLGGILTGKQLAEIRNQVLCDIARLEYEWDAPKSLSDSQVLRVLWNHV